MIKLVSIVLSMVSEHISNNKSDFSGILNGTLEYRTIPLDYSMVKHVSMVLSTDMPHIGDGNPYFLPKIL